MRSTAKKTDMVIKIASAVRNMWSGLSGQKTIILLGLAITIGLPLLLIMMPTFLNYFNGKLYDIFLLRANQGKISDRIVIVDIDDDSLRVHGQWPWPRYKIAAMVDALNQAGAAAIGIDMVFPEKDRTALPDIPHDLKQYRGPAVESVSSMVFPDNDHLLAETISKSPAVLGYQFLFDPTAAGGDCRLHPLLLTDRSVLWGVGSFPWRATHVICNLPLFDKTASSSGFFNVAPDADGILRRAPMVIAYHDQLYPALALASVMKTLKVRQAELIRRIDEYVLVIGQIEVPLDSRGAMLIRYRGEGHTYPYVSAADLLSGSVPASRIKDKIVFVGTTAAGLREFRSTPTDPIFSGIEIHATIADNLLSADFLRRPTSALGTEFLLSLLCGILYVLTTRSTGALKNLLIYAIAAIGMVWVAFHFFNARGIYLSPFLPLMVLTANFAFLNLLSFWREERRSRKYAHDLMLTQGAIIESMAALTETRDRETGGHIKRTQEYVRLLAEALRNDSAYAPFLTDETIGLLYKSAPLHDIGKVGISDKILLKPGALSEEEFEVIKKHVTIGKEIIEGIQKNLGAHPFIKIVHEIVYTHHEKWDGSGYPQGLKGNQIPLTGRIMAIADMYDALTSRREYKEPVSHEQAIQVMRDCAPGSFDPQIFKRFLAIADKFKNVSRNL